MGKLWKQCQTLFWGGSRITADGDCSHEMKRRLLLGRKVMTNLDSILKSRHIILPTKISIVRLYISSNQVWMWELNHKQGWALKNWCIPIVVMEKTLESPWDSKEIKSVNPEGSHLWIFFWRSNAEAEAPIFYPLLVKSQLIEKDSRRQ